MANCLVTRLRDEVLNDNLPELNCIDLDLLPAAERAFCNDDKYVGLLIGPHVEVVSKVPFRPLNMNNPARYSYNLNGAAVIYFMADDLPETEMKRAISIKGDGIYNITAACIHGKGYAFKFTENSLNSLYYCNNLIAMSCEKTTSIKDDVKVVCFNSVSIAESFSNTITENYPNVLAIYSNQLLANVNIAINVATLSKFVNVKIISCRPNGNIVGLPNSVKYLPKPNSTLYGSLEAFVEDRRSKGINSGSLSFANPVLSWIVTYNGTAIKNLDESVRPIVGSWSHFVWTENSMGFVSEAPEGFNYKSTPYEAMTAILNGEEF